MDGLSAAASIIAVLQLSSEVADYISTVKGATKEWKRLRYEVLGCEVILQQIEDDRAHVDADQDWSDKIKALEAPDGPLARLSKALGFVKEKIEPGSGFRKAFSAVKWPFTAKEVEKMIATIEREKSLLNLALTSNCRRLIQDIKQKSKHSEERLSGLLKELEVSSNNILQSVHDHSAEANAGIAELKGHNDDRQRLEILGWLSSSNYPAQQSDFIRRREPETGTWLLQSTEYQAWLATDSGQTLFCPGMPGAGKTMLTSIVIDDLTTKFGSDPDIAITYIFYNFRRTTEETAEHVIMSLLKQLVQQRSTVPEDVCMLFKQHSNITTRPSLDEASRVLKSVAGMFSTVFVLVDALDEADRACWSKLIPLISCIQSTHKVNIFATSRFIPEITRKFSGVPSLEIRASTQDVERYLEGQMQQLQAYEDWTPKLQDEIKTVISNAVGGMFLLATIYLVTLDDKVTPREVRHTLAQFQPQGAGSTEAQRREVLDKAYDKAMERINGQKPGFRTLALRALAWITFAKRPLTPLDLRHALAIKPGDTKLDEDELPKIERIVSVCAGLVTFDPETRDIRLAHYTTQDYFQATWQKWFPTAHDDITLSLITCLSFDGLRSGILKYADRIPYNYFQSTPSLAFYRYASENWGHHARESANADQTIIDFLTGSMAAYNLAIYECIVNDEFPAGGIPSITGLHVAAWFGLERVADVLLGLHDVNSRDWADRTPLSYATDEGQSDFMGILLQRGADPNAKDVYGYTPLHIGVAAQRGVISVMSLLLRHGADVQAKDFSGNTPLHHAVGSPSSTAAILCLQESGADIEATNNGGETPLFQAVNLRNNNAMALLLDKGANIEATNEDGKTPLVVSVSHWDGLDAFRLLLDRGANIRATDQGGCTILGLAAHGSELSEGNTNREMVELLIERGELTGHNWGTNAHDFDAGRGCRCLDTARYLLERAAIVESPGADVWKPNGMGAPKGWLDAVQILVERGHTGGPQIRDQKRKLRELRDLLELFGKKVLDITRDLSRGKTKARRDITQLLLETGADVEVGFSSWVMAEWYRYFMILLLEGLGELRGLSERELQELWNLERLWKLERPREYRERREYEDDYKLFSLALETFYLGHKELVELEEEYLDLPTRLHLIRRWLKSARPVRERRASFGGQGQETNVCNHQGASQEPFHLALSRDSRLGPDISCRP